MEKYRYKKLNAFAAGSSSGNPAACLYLSDTQKLSPEEMQKIAKEHKGFVSEVVYCGKSEKADYRLYYYSSECEVDFCGHGTVACMYSLVAEDEGLLKRPQLSIETKKGILTVYNEVKGQNAVFIAAPSPVLLDTVDIPQKIASALHANESEIDGNFSMGFVNAGLATFIVPIRSLHSLVSLWPDEAALKAFCYENGIDIILAFSKETQDKDFLYHTRVFAPKFGYLEDPATGSGNSAFGNYLLFHGLWEGKSISIEQGPEMGAFNTVKLKCTEDKKVLFGGSAVTTIEGCYCLAR